MEHLFTLNDIQIILNYSLSVLFAPETVTVTKKVFYIFLQDGVKYIRLYNIGAGLYGLPKIPLVFKLDFDCPVPPLKEVDVFVGEVKVPEEKKGLVLLACLGCVAGFFFLSNG